MKEQEGKRKTPAPPSSRGDVAEKNKHHWRRLREVFSEESLCSVRAKRKEDVVDIG